MFVYLFVCLFSVLNRARHPPGRAFNSRTKLKAKNMVYRPLKAEQMSVPSSASANPSSSAGSGEQLVARKQGAMLYKKRPGVPADTPCVVPPSLVEKRSVP